MKAIVTFWNVLHKDRLQCIERSLKKNKYANNKAKIKPPYWSLCHWKTKNIAYFAEQSMFDKCMDTIHWMVFDEWIEDVQSSSKELISRKNNKGHQVDALTFISYEWPIKLMQSNYRPIWRSLRALKTSLNYMEQKKWHGR